MTRILKSSSEPGTLHGGSQGPKVGDRLEQIIRHWPSAHAREWAFRVAADLCADPSILAFVALGSAVRPVEAAQDLDFLVVFRDSQPKLGPIPLDVDLRAYSADLVNDKIEAGHDLLGWALHFGVPICEQSSYWTDLSNDWKGRIPLPSAEKANERAARARRLVDELRAVGDWEAAAEQLVSCLTHQARARLVRVGVYPASRPELPAQLRDIGEHSLATELASALNDRLSASFT
jgi:hypothetical protein